MDEVTSILEPKVSEEVFENIWDVIRKSSWLAASNRRTEALAEIFEQSKKEPSRWALITHLVNEFTYIGDTEFDGLKEDLAQQIVGWSEEGFKLLICATSDADVADGSQSLLQAIKNAPPFLENDFLEGQFLNSITAPIKMLEGKNIRKKRRIILVDDFIGSGKTIEKKVKWLDRSLTEIKLRHMVEIRVCVLACMTKANDVLNDLKKAGLIADFYSPLMLSRGISDHFAGEDLKNNLTLMGNIENELALRNGHLRLSQYKLGYGKSEALFNWANNNLPNNVFPIFWWPKMKNGIRRKTMFGRIR